MVQDKWFVTWRHVHRTPKETAVYVTASKEEGEAKQAELLNTHIRYVCHSCTTLTIPPDSLAGWPVLGDNDYIVSNVRPEKAVYRTLGFK